MQTDKPGSLSDKFAGFGAAPTDQLWDSIAVSLDQKKKKRRGVFWWWLGGIAACCLVIFSVYQIGYHYGKTGTQPMTEVSVNSSQLSTHTSDTDAGTNLHSPQRSTDPSETDAVSANLHAPQLSTHTSDTDTGTNLHSPQRSTDPSETDAVSANLPSSRLSTNTSGTNAASANLPSPQLLMSEGITNLPAASVLLLTAFSEPALGLRTTTLEKRKSAGQWELGFSVGTQTGYQAYNQKIAVDSNPQSLTADNLSLENSITGSGVQSLSGLSEMDATIKRPFSVDFSIARTIGKRGSVGSGIGLNYFTGQNSYTVPTQMNIRSNFLSIAIPLVVDFDFVKRRRFEISIGTGVVSEFPFRVTTETMYTTPYESTAVSKNFSGGYMGSVLFRTGFSYRLNEHLKIGLNPNLRYYFYQSLKSDMPVLKRNLWGGVSLGAVWTF